jgi:hypothetical protein
VIPALIAAAVLGAYTAARVDDYLTARASRRRAAANDGIDPLEPAHWTYSQPRPTSNDQDPSQ